MDSQVHGGDWRRVFLATHHLLNAQYYAKPNKEMQSDMFILFNLYDCLLKSPLTGETGPETHFSLHGIVQAANYRTKAENNEEGNKVMLTEWHLQSARQP